MTHLKLDPTTCEIIVGLHVHFDDFNKMTSWLKAKNLNFGGCAPIDLINKGKGKKVLKFIDDALDGRGEI